MKICFFFCHGMDARYEVTSALHSLHERRRHRQRSKSLLLVQFFAHVVCATSSTLVKLLMFKRNTVSTRHKAAGPVAWH